MRTINVADFFPYPGGRYRRHGKGSGQEFREDHLIPILKTRDHARIVLDGASGYPPSFLEEAFGGLIREGFSAEEIRKCFEISAGPAFEAYVRMIWEYVEKANRARVEH